MGAWVDAGLRGAVSGASKTVEGFSGGQAARADQDVDQGGEPFGAAETAARAVSLHAHHAAEQVIGCQAGGRAGVRVAAKGVRFVAVPVATIQKAMGRQRACGCAVKQDLSDARAAVEERFHFDQVAVEDGGPHAGAGRFEANAKGLVQQPEYQFG